MTDQSNEDTTTGEKNKKQEQLSPAKAGENRITRKGEFSRAFQRAHEHDNTLSGIHDTALEILEGATTLVSSRVVSQKTDSSSEAYLKTITNPERTSTSCPVERKRRKRLLNLEVLGKNSFQLRIGENKTACLFLLKDHARDNSLDRYQLALPVTEV